MASIGIWPSPVSGQCIGADWYSLASGSTLGCPFKLSISADTFLLSKIAVDFAGRGKVGVVSFGCGGADSYVTFTDNQTAKIDVWAAYLAGVWASSTTVKVYLGHDLRVGDIPIYADNALLASRKTKAGCSSELANCGTVIQATITVNSDGTFSIT